MNIDVLIVGGGLAGCCAAETIGSESNFSVLVADAGAMASTEIMGFSAPANPGDSEELFLRDILRAGGGGNDPELARILASHAMDELRHAEKLGIRFDRKADDSATYDMVNALGSSCPRVVHSGTTTGRELLAKLAISTVRMKIIHLLKIGARVAGAIAEDGTIIHAKAVILAGGGFAGLWKFSTWSKKLRGDALLLAMQAGAEVRDLGIVQFEPTVTVAPTALAGFPVITTVLNEGARLSDRNGKMLLPAGSPVPGKRQLAKIIQHAIDQNLEPVRYDLSNVPEGLFCKKYPEYHRKFLSFFGHWQKVCFEVKPGAHTTLGGIVIEPDASVRHVPGLFAAGECVGGIHGKDRLGGNAGLEVLVFGHLAGRSAIRYVAEHPFPPEEIPEVVDPAVPVAPSQYRIAAEILDQCCKVSGETCDLRRGLERCKELENHALRALLERIFSEKTSD